MNTARPDFARRVCVAVGIATLAVALLALLWATTDVLLLLFAAILLACLLRGMANAVTRWTHIPSGWSLATVVILTLAGLFAGGWFLAPHVSAQVDDLSVSLSNSLAQLRYQVSQYVWGRSLLEEVPGVAELAGRGNLLSRVTGIFSTTLGLLANAILVVFVGFYLAVSPGVYINGVVRLFPKARRERIRGVLGEIGQTLLRWLSGRMVLMVLNGGLTTLSLWLLDIPMAITLGVLAGLLNFVPNIGPIIAGVPAVLIAWTISPATALYVLGVYVVLQSADGYIFTPLVQKWTVALPPALTIAAQLLFGVLAGVMGLLLAGPITAAAMVIVKELYLEDALGDKEDA